MEGGDTRLGGGGGGGAGNMRVYNFVDTSFTVLLAGSATTERGVDYSMCGIECGIE